MKINNTYLLIFIECGFFYLSMQRVLQKGIFYFVMTYLRNTEKQKEEISGMMDR